ncbi:MAG: MBL fold metallo-hydrolase [Nevskia sp.]
MQVQSRPAGPLRIILLVPVLATLAMWLLVLHSPRAGTEFPLDLAEVRRLAQSLPGDKAAEVRYEQLGAFRVYEAMVVAGDPWRRTLLPIYAYQLVFADRGTLLIDTGLDRKTAEHTLMLPVFDDRAYARVAAAMAKAAKIVITHEHEDHIGSIASFPDFAALRPKLLLTEEQLAHPEDMKPAVLPWPLLKDYRPLRYERMTAIAPGVVLIKSPGHSPGSQMVYVQRADGRELLFIGDIAAQLRNIALQRARPWFMTLVIGEDRQAVLAELKTLRRLMIEQPAIAVVPGHDGEVVEILDLAGVLQAGMKP